MRNMVNERDFVISVINDNKYIPFHRMTYFSSEANTLFIIQPGFDNCLKSNTIGNIRKAFDYGYHSKIIINGSKFYFAKGIMYDSHFNILMLIAQDKEKYLENTMKNIPLKLEGNTEFVFFYSSELMMKPEYATLHRRLYKEIVTPYLIKGMEVRILTSKVIAENTFVRKPVVKKFASLDKLDNYLKEVLPTFLYDDRVEEPEDIQEVSEIKEVDEILPGIDGTSFNVTFRSDYNTFSIPAPSTGTSGTFSTTTWNGYSTDNFFPDTGIDEQLTEEDLDEDDGLTDASWNEELPVEEEALLYGVPGEDDSQIVLYTSAEGAAALESAFDAELRASLEEEAHDYDEEVQTEQEMEASWFEEQERLTDAAIATSQVFLARENSLTPDEAYHRSLVERLRPYVDSVNLLNLRTDQALYRTRRRESNIELIDDTTSIELIDDTE